jgi:hypothetical protein
MSSDSQTTAGSQREAILARFTAWLDEALGEETPPTGIAADLLASSARARDECDLLSLWSAQTALAQEVKLQGRTFHQLREAVAGLPETVSALAASSERVLAETGVAREEKAFEGVLGLLLDLRERLRCGRDAARDHVARRSFMARLFAPRREAEAAFVRGYELAIERLDDFLRERGIEEVACLGRPFDPHTMAAVAVAEQGRAAPGTVLSVQRSGHTRRGELLRVAEVEVARREKA